MNKIIRITKPTFIETLTDKIPYARVFWKFIKSETPTALVFSASEMGGILTTELYGSPITELGDYYIQLIAASPVEQQDSLDPGDKILYHSPEGPQILEYTEDGGYGMGVKFSDGQIGKVAYSKTAKILYIANENIPGEILKRIFTGEMEEDMEDLIQCDTFTWGDTQRPYIPLEERQYVKFDDKKRVIVYSPVKEKKTTVDFEKGLDLVLNNPANHFTETSRDILDTLRTYAKLNKM